MNLFYSLVPLYFVRIILIKNIFIISESVKLESNTTLQHILRGMNSPPGNDMFGFIMC